MELTTTLNNVSSTLSATSTMSTELYTSYENGTVPTAISPTLATLPSLEYYSLDYKVIATIAYLLLGMAAVIGNVMVIIVVLRVSHMRTPTNCYLVSLALADAIVGAVTIIMHSVPENLLPKTSFIYGGPGCLIIISLEYLAFNVSALSITAFTIERYIAICHPMRAHIMCSVSRATKIIIALWVFEIAYSMQWFFLLDYKTQDFAGGHTLGHCWYRMDKVSYIHAVYLVDCFLYYIIPVAVSIPLYAIIGRVLFRSTTLQNTIRKGYEAGAKENGSSTTRMKLMKNGDGGHSPRRIKDSGSAAMSSRKQVVKMLVVVVALFGILWAPYRMLVVYNWFNTSRQYHNEWFLFFCRTCLFLNSVVNPILYNFMSIKFRRAFTKLWTCRDPRRRDSPFSWMSNHDTDATTKAMRMSSATGFEPSRVRTAAYLNANASGNHNRTSVI